jgi:hypothetical protein
MFGKGYVVNVCWGAGAGGARAARGREVGVKASCACCVRASGQRACCVKKKWKVAKVEWRYVRAL